jgi:hypothetical protein
MDLANPISNCLIRTGKSNVETTNQIASWKRQIKLMKWQIQIKSPKPQQHLPKWKTQFKLPKLAKENAKLELAN